jgi:hypothetical protein
MVLFEATDGFDLANSDLAVEAVNRLLLPGVYIGLARHALAAADIFKIVRCYDHEVAQEDGHFLQRSFKPQHVSLPVAEKITNMFPELGADVIAFAQNFVSGPDEAVQSAIAKQFRQAILSWIIDDAVCFGRQDQHR